MCTGVYMSCRNYVYECVCVHMCTNKFFNIFQTKKDEDFLFNYEVTLLYYII